MTRNENLAPPPNEPPPEPTLGADDDLPLYKPAQAAKLLGTTEWWIKNEARYRRIPFTWVGNAIRLKPKHIRAIAAGFREVDPTAHGRKRPTTAA